MKRIAILVPAWVLIFSLGQATIPGGRSMASSSSGSRFKLAVVQMTVEGGEKTRNLERAVARIREAASQGARLALLPEAMDLGWTHPSALTEAEAIPDGSVCRRLMAAAAENAIFVCAGITEREGDRVYNAAVIIDSRGNLLIRHRKLNELDIGHDVYSPGDRLNVCHTELGTLGLLICADATAAHQSLLRALGYMGADIILSPSAWAMPPEHDNAREPYGDTWRGPYRTVAREFQLWVVGASNVGWLTAGAWKGWKCIGCSLVIDPEGREVLQGPYGDGADTILYVDVQTRPRPAWGTKWQELWARP